VASSSAKLVLALGPSESDAIHLERFVRFVEEEEEENDDEDKILKVMQSKHRITQLNQTLRDTPNFLTRKTFNGETLLHWACVVDDLELVKHILSLGGPLNIADNAGNTPLHFALLHESWSSAVVLVEKDCQANVSNNRGDTPLLLLAESPTPGEVRVAQLVKTLLSRGDIPWARDKWKNNVWHQLGRFRTLQNDLWELYELLLHAGGVDLINAKNIHGETPLIIALVKQNLSLISFLRQTSARYDFIDDSGWNFLHYVSYFGDSLCCRLLDGFEISCLDIRTSNNDGWTPLEIFRCMVSKYFVLSEKELASAYAVKLWNARKENPLEDIVSGDKAEAFENLLRGIRDRVLIQEIKELELIISKIEAQDLASARDDLKRLVEGKVKAKIDDEAETFRAIELDIRGGRHELAIESIEVFIEVSRDRMKISPFDEEENPWKLSESDSEASDGTSWESERSVVEIETDAEDEVGWGSSEDDDDRSNDDVSREGEDEDEGWKTADED
jgi:ankyrin repeat protein